MALWYKMGKHSAQQSKESLQCINVLGSCLCFYNHLQSMLESLSEPMDIGCESVASQLEPSFAYHIVRALVAAIMTAVVVGLRRGYDEEPQFIANGGTNCQHHNFFFPLHIQIFFRNWCNLKPFKCIIYSCFKTA